MSLLAANAEYMADGGGKVIAALKILRGPERIGWLYHCIARRFAGVHYRLIRVNGELGAAAIMEGQVFSVMAFEVDGERVSRIYNVRNPDKLQGITLPASSSDNAAVTTQVVQPSCNQQTANAERDKRLSSTST